MGAFSILIGLGTLLGLGWVAWQAPERFARRYLDDAAPVLIGGLLGGRAGYVLANLPYFRLHIDEIPQMWLGGFSGMGALAGGLLFLLVLAWFTRQPFFQIADALIPLVLILSITAWLASWQTGVAYGQKVAIPSHTPEIGEVGQITSLALPARDEFGNLDRRVPVQLIGAIASLAILISVDRVRRDLNFPGVAACLGLALLSLELFGLSLLRADPGIFWQGLRVDAWIAAGFFVLGLAGLPWTYLHGLSITRSFKKRV